MKRHIFTALSLTLLTSSPITLNAGKKKDKNKTMSLAAFQDSTPEKAVVSQLTDEEPLASLPSAHEESIPTDEFDKSNTQAQRAALFGAITAIQLKKNKGLKQVDCFHELERQGKLADLYASEDTHNIKVAASTATQAIDTNQAISRPEISARDRELYSFLLLTRWQLITAQAQLASTKAKLKEALEKQEQSVNTDVLDLFPSSPITQSNELPDERGAQTLQDDDSDGLSQFSTEQEETQEGNAQAIQTNDNNNATDSASNINTAENAGNNNNDDHGFETISQDPSYKSTISPVTPPTQRAPTIGGWSISYLFGYKYNN